jgi:hypothetical protein
MRLAMFKPGGQRAGDWRIGAAVNTGGPVSWD